MKLENQTKLSIYLRAFLACKRRLKRCLNRTTAGIRLQAKSHGNGYGSLQHVTLSKALGALLLGAMLLSHNAHARKSDFSQPIDVSADRSEYDERAGVQTLIGNVEITQGTMTIKADKIAIKLVDNQLSRIEGSGSPIQFQQENEAGELVTGTANSIDYDAVNGSLILTGSATLSQPRQRLQSERIVFNSTEQKVSAEGGNKGRVSIRIQPPAAK